MEKPVWLLDIDGVVNAVAPGALTREAVWPGADWVFGTAGGWDGHIFSIIAAKPVIDFINKVHEEGLAEIRSLTTWGEHAVNVWRLLGLPEFPCQTEYPVDTTQKYGHWWKQPCAEHVALVEGRDLIWTDDQLHTELSISSRYRLQKAGALLIRPNDMTGLVAADLARVDAYLQASAAALHLGS